MSKLIYNSEFNLDRRQEIIADMANICTEYRTTVPGEATLEKISEVTGMTMKTISNALRNITSNSKAVYKTKSPITSARFATLYYLLDYFKLKVMIHLDDKEIEYTGLDAPFRDLAVQAANACPLSIRQAQAATGINFAIISKLRQQSGNYKDYSLFTYLTVIALEVDNIYISIIDPSAE